MTKVTKNRRTPRHELDARIYESALTLFRANTYAATSVEQIVSEAGVAKGTFFNFFPTKLDVLKRYYRQIDAEIAELRKALDPSQPRKALLDHVEAVASLFDREGPLMRDLLVLIAMEPELRSTDEASGANDVREIAEFIRRSIDLGRLRADLEPEWVAAAVIDLWAGAVRAWQAEPTERSLPMEFAPRINVLFCGLELPHEST